MRRFGRLLGWFIVVDALITIFGVTTAPLLLSLAADSVVGFLIIRSFMEMRAAELVTQPGMSTVANDCYDKGEC